MLLVKEIAHGKDLGGISVGEELEVGVVLGLSAGVVNAELGGELVKDVYDGDDGVRAEVDIRLGGGYGFGGGGEIWGNAEVALEGDVSFG